MANKIKTPFEQGASDFGLGYQAAKRFIMLLARRHDLTNRRLKFGMIKLPSDAHIGAEIKMTYPDEVDILHLGDSRGVFHTFLRFNQGAKCCIEVGITQFLHHRTGRIAVMGYL